MTPPNLLLIDRWENMTGALVALVLQRRRSINMRLVVGGSEGLAAIQAESPDAVFIYLWAGDPDAIEFCQKVKATPETKHIPVIVWGAMTPDKICPKLQEAGAAGYLLQPCAPNEILDAYDVVMRGEEYYPDKYFSQSHQV